MSETKARAPLAWPSREEWAKNRRTFYGYEAHGSVSKELADYATPEEIALALKDLRRAVRAASEFYKKSDLSICGKDMRRGRVPFVHAFRKVDLPPSALMIVEQYEKACEEAVETYRKEVEALPIDDEAWADELDHRRRVDRRFNDPIARFEDRATKR